MIRILLVDDHTVVRAGLEELLSSAQDVEVVGSVADGPDAVALAVGRAPDVILMDLMMPTMDGIEATERILSAAPHARIVVLTSFSDQERILRAIDAGAVGYLLKDAEPEELFAGVRAAARGESPLAPKAASAVLRARLGQSSASQLTEREREVLSLLATGLQNKHIARQLGISEKTVKAHLTSIYGRLGLTNRAEAALWAAEHGLTAH